MLQPFASWIKKIHFCCRLLHFIPDVMGLFIRINKFYRQYFDLISKFQVRLFFFSAEDFGNLYSDLVYKFKKIDCINNFSSQFIKVISHYKTIDYIINVLQQTACLVVNPIMVDNFAFLFNCTLLGQTSDSMMSPT